MTTSTVAHLLTQELKHTDIVVKGWVRTFRANRFIALNDGSCLQSIQCVVDFESMDEALLKRITTEVNMILDNLRKGAGNFWLAPPIYF